MKFKEETPNYPLHDQTFWAHSELMLFLFFLHLFWVFLPSSCCSCDHSLVHGLVWNCCKLYYLSKGQRGQNRLWDSVKFKDIQWGRALCALITQGSSLLKAAFNVQLKPTVQVAGLGYGPFVSRLFLSVSAFWDPRVVGFSFGGDLFFNPKFWCASPAWDLGSQLHVGICHYPGSVWFSQPPCPAIRVRRCQRRLWATCSLRAHLIILPLEVNLWHGRVQVLLL